MIVYAISKKEEGQWKRAKIVGIHYQAMYPIAKKAQTDYQLTDEFFGGEEALEEGDNDEDDDQRLVRKVQVQFLEGLGEEEGDTEYLGLEDVMLIETQDKRKRKHRDRSSSSSNSSSNRREERR
jgi:hypothetical protein